VRRRDLTEVRDLLRKGADPSRRDLLGETPLFEACSAGDAGIAASLLLHMADPLAKASPFPSDISCAELAQEPGVRALVELFAGKTVEPELRQSAMAALPPHERRPTAWTLGRRGMCTLQEAEEQVQASVADCEGIGAPPDRLERPSPTPLPPSSPSRRSRTSAGSCESPSPGVSESPGAVALLRDEASPQRWASVPEWPSLFSSSPSPRSRYRSGTFDRYMVTFAPFVAERSTPEDRQGEVLNLHAWGEVLELGEWAPSGPWRRCCPLAGAAETKVGGEVSTGGWVPLTHILLGPLMRYMDTISKCTCGRVMDPDLYSFCPVCGADWIGAAAGTCNLEDVEEESTANLAPKKLSYNGEEYSEEEDEDEVVRNDGSLGSSFGIGEGIDSDMEAEKVVVKEFEERRLAHAVRSLNLADVLTCLNDGDDPNYQDQLGETVLFEAVCEGATEITAALIAFQADVNIRSHAGATCAVFGEDSDTLMLIDICQGQKVDPARKEALLQAMTPSLSNALRERLAAMEGIAAARQSPRSVRRDDGHR